MSGSRGRVARKRDGWPMVEPEHIVARATCAGAVRRWPHDPFLSRASDGGYDAANFGGILGKRSGTTAHQMHTIPLSNSRCLQLAGQRGFTLCFGVWRGCGRYSADGQYDFGCANVCALDNGLQTLPAPFMRARTPVTDVVYGSSISRCTGQFDCSDSTWGFEHVSFLGQFSMHQPRRYLAARVSGEICRCSDGRSARVL